MMFQLSRLLLLASLFALLTQTAHAQWEGCVGADAGVSMLVEGSTIYAAVGNGDGTFISTDDGQHWTNTNLFSNPCSFARCGSYLLIGTWALGDSERGVYRFFDSSGTWVYRGDGDPGGAGIVYTPFAFMQDGPDVFAGTSKGVYLLTASELVGGFHWIQPDHGALDDSVLSLASLGGTLIAGCAHGVYFSTDRGVSWVARNTGLGLKQGNHNFQALAILKNTIVVGSDGGISTSTDMGDHWLYADSGLNTGRIHALAVSGSNLFAAAREDPYAGGRDGGVYWSTNNGVSWTEKIDGIGTTGGERDFESLATSNLYLFAGRMDGGFVRRRLSDFGISSAVPTATTHSSISAYPNPSSGSITINVTSDTRRPANIIVFNLMGAEVARLYDGALDAGHHSFTWDATGIASGVYRCVIRSPGMVESLPFQIAR